MIVPGAETLTVHDGSQVNRNGEVIMFVRGSLSFHFLATVLLVGCSDGIDPTRSQVDTPESQAPRLSASMMSGDPCPYVNDYSFHRDCWSAGQTIQLKVPSELQNEMNEAVGDWNQYLTQHSSAPRFSVSTSFGSVVVLATGSGQAGWCGNYSETRDTIFMRRTCSGHTGSFAATMKHELAGLLGWSEEENFEGNPDRFSPGMTTMCTVFLPGKDGGAPKIINSEVCAHEADGVILEYAGLAATIPVGFEFFHDSIYMHVRMLPHDATINLGDSLKIVADTFYSGAFGGGGGGGGDPWLLGGFGHIPIAKPTNGAVIWGSKNSAVASHRGGGWFRGEAPGTTWVRAQPSGSASTKTRWWLPFLERGDSVMVTVAAPPPPPPPPFVVTADEMPIHNAGTRTFTAHIGDASSDIVWLIDDSRSTGTMYEDTVTTTGRTLLWGVTYGSYNLRFKIRTTDSGIWHIQDIPVCTIQTEPDFWGGDKQGGGSTNSVENCPPPGGGQF